MRKSDEFLILRTKLTLIEPKFGPWGPEPTPKVVSICSYFLDFSLNPKLDPFWSQPNPIFDPEGPLQPDFGSRGPSLTQLNPMPKPNYRISIHETNDLIHSNEIFKENITNNSNTIATFVKIML